MKTSTVFFALLILFIAFSACKKTLEDEIKYPGTRIKKTSLYYQGNKTVETNYQYDATGRVIKESVSDNQTIEYSYLPGKVIMKAYLPYHTGEIPTSTMLLNDKGMQTSNLPSTTILYDEDGYLLEMTLLVNNIPNSHTFKIENGNTVMWTLRTGNHLENIAYDHIYEFLPNSTNTIGYENMGMAFNGKQDVNLVSKETIVTHHSGGTSKSTINYLYELDAKNRVVKKSTVEEPDNYTLYTYYD